MEEIEDVVAGVVEKLKHEAELIGGKPGE